MQNAFEILRAALQKYFIIRWILANTLGWSVGLYLGSLILSLLGGLAGLLAGGAAAGAVVGAAQGWVLRGQAGGVNRRWIAYSALGGVLGGLLVLVLSFALLLGHIGLLILGGVFGAVFGAAQWLALREQLDGAALWLAANIVGGALCSLCSFSGFPLWLPIFCTVGPYLFGALTGYALRRLMRDIEANGFAEFL